MKISLGARAPLPLSHAPSFAKGGAMNIKSAATTIGLAACYRLAPLRKSARRAS
jgi:hypothetical protein